MDSVPVGGGTIQISIMLTQSNLQHDKSYASAHTQIYINI